MKYKRKESLRCFSRQKKKNFQPRRLLQHSPPPLRRHPAGAVLLLSYLFSPPHIWRNLSEETPTSRRRKRRINYERIKKERKKERTRKKRLGMSGREQGEEEVGLHDDDRGSYLITTHGKSKREKRFGTSSFFLFIFFFSHVDGSTAICLSISLFEQRWRNDSTRASYLQITNPSSRSLRLMHLSRREDSSLS